MMYLTVGMPVHGAISVFKEAYLALRDTLKMLNAKAQIIVINDFSEDVDARELAVFLQGFDNTVLLHTAMVVPGPNPNLGLAMNLALQMVRPHDDFYLNLESDVLINAKALMRLTAALDGDASVPAVFPLMRTRDGRYDFIFWNRGLLDTLPTELQLPRACAWGNAGCLLVRGSHARNKAIRVDEQFKLWCADGDYTCCLYAATKQPIMYHAKAEVVHIGRQSSQEGAGKYDDLIPLAVNAFDTKWSHLLAAGCLL